MTSLLALPPFVTTDADPAGVYNPADAGSDRGSGFPPANTILRHCDTLFATWQGYNPNNGKYTVYVGTNQLGTGLWRTPVALDDPQTIAGYPMGNHGTASIIADSAGYLHLFYGPHHKPMLEAVSVYPWDASAFRTSVVVPTAPWPETTYSSVVRDSSGTLHNVYRGRNAGQYRMIYQRGTTSTNGTSTWDLPVVLASTADGTSNATGYSLYTGSIAVRKRKFSESLHVAYQLYYHPVGAAARAWGYLRSNDGGYTWRDWQGADVTAILPIDSSAAKSVHLVESSPIMDVRVGNITVDPWGDPWISVTYLAHPGRPILGGYDTKLWNLKSGQWSTISLSPYVSSLGPSWRVSCATITFDSEGVLYVAAEVVDMTDQTPDSWFAGVSKEVVVLMSTDLGQTFQLHPISMPLTTRPRWLTSIERSTTPEMISIPALQYTDGSDSSNANGKGTDIVFVPLYKY